MFDLIAFDADDTLWHNERLYQDVQRKIAQLAAPYSSGDGLIARFDAADVQNIAFFGYGIKSFALSMIQAVVDVTEGAIPSRELAHIVDFALEMIQAPIELLPHVAATIPTLAASHRLMIITKGDLLDQERKLERSGLAGYFPDVEVVNHKTDAVYRAILDRRGIDPARFLMIGNALRSDIVPVLTLGGHAIHIPYETSWAHEHVPDEVLGALDYVTLPHMGDLPMAVAALERRTA
jgi:putative hydrolase of the HAD superfamily